MLLLLFANWLKIIQGLHQTNEEKKRSLKLQRTCKKFATQYKSQYLLMLWLRINKNRKKTPSNYVTHTHTQHQTARVRVINRAHCMIKGSFVSVCVFYFRFIDLLQFLFFRKVWFCLQSPHVTNAITWVYDLHLGFWAWEILKIRIRTKWKLISFISWIWSKWQRRENFFYFLAYANLTGHIGEKKRL